MAKPEWPSDCVVDSSANCRGVKGKTNMVSQGFFFCWGWRWWSDQSPPHYHNLHSPLADLSDSQWQIMNALEVCRMQLHNTRSVNPATPFHGGYRRGVRLFMNLSEDPYPQRESLLTVLIFWDSAHLSSESDWSLWSLWSYQSICKDWATLRSSSFKVRNGGRSSGFDAQQILIVWKSGWKFFRILNEGENLINSLKRHECTH